MTMEMELPTSTLWAFLLVLARVSGVVAFLPVPAFKGAALEVRAVLGVLMSFALLPAARLPSPPSTIGGLCALVLSESAFGLAIGIVVGFAVEAFGVAMQAVAAQAGYSYATTIDPASQADSGVLQVLANLLASCLFFVLGIDRGVLRVLGSSLERLPLGTWQPDRINPQVLVSLGSSMFTVGVRLALPVIALLLLLDLSIAFTSRMQQQLQLLSLAFPLKMLAALAALAFLVPVYVRIFGDTAARSIGILWRITSQ